MKKIYGFILTTALGISLLAIPATVSAQTITDSTANNIVTSQDTSRKQIYQTDLNLINNYRKAAKTAKDKPFLKAGNTTYQKVVKQYQQSKTSYVFDDTAQTFLVTNRLTFQKDFNSSL